MSVIVTILGCGKLGTSFLQGYQKHSSSSSSSSSSNPGRVHAIIRTLSSLQRLKKTFDTPDTGSGSGSGSGPGPGPGPGPGLEILCSTDALPAIQESAVIIVACKPASLGELLQPLYDVLHGKLVISLLGGTSVLALRQLLPEDCRVARAIPNVGAKFGESVTVLEDDSRALAKEDRETVESLFGAVGSFRWVLPGMMDVGSSLAASVPAVFAVLIQAVANAGRREGMEAELALELAREAANSTVSLMRGGLGVDDIVGQVATKGGSTQKGLQMLTERAMEDNLQEAVEAIIKATQGLGKK